MILLGYGEVHVVDLDTIDLSNLNRQFLFRQKDIKQPKASTAVNAVQQFNFFKTKLIPYQASIYETDLFPLEWFKQFDLIFNALDNMAARSYINKIALFLDKIVMESGTTGTAGQAGPTFPNKTECYDCSTRETPKTFPVCTIRSTPSQPVHCIHWAKSFLFQQLFSEDEAPEVAPEGKDTAELGTDNAEEIKNLIAENNELIELKNAMNDDDFAIKVIEKVFSKDIEKLLLITDLWKTRKEPTPLDLSSYLAGVEAVTTEDLGTGQKPWTIEQNIKVFIDATKRLQKRMKTEKEIEFDKDDEDTLEFVVAAANIRSFIFSIQLKSKFDIKSIAGNIIPAIATTNAVIAGFSALISLKLFKETREESIAASSGIFTSSGSKFISQNKPQKPNPHCPACSIPRGVMSVDNTLTVQELVDELLEKYGYDEEIAISIGSKLLYDVDFDDNKDKVLSDIGVVYGAHVAVSDENDEKETIELYVELNNDKEIKLPDLEIPPKPEREQEEPLDDEAQGEADNEVLMVADFDDDEIRIIDTETLVEKRKLDAQEPATKKQKLEEDVQSNDGIITLD